MSQDRDMADSLFDQDWAELLKGDLEKLVELSEPEEKPAPEEERIVLREGERRWTAVLFLDMKGFTALSERFDHEVIDRLVDKVFKVFTNQIERREGWVEKYEGDAILASFGSHRAHEDDAARAVDSGLAILESLAGLQPILRQRNIEVSVRIGVNVGEVTRSRRGEFSVIVGDTVNTAARLEQNATPGSVLVSESARRLAGSRFLYEEHLPIAAKGKAEPVVCFQVVGRAPAKERWLRSELLPEGLFVGRDDESAVLRDALAEVGAPPGDGPGRHRLIVLAGPAGIGKSRLAYELVKGLPEPVRAGGILRGASLAFAGQPFETLIAFLRNRLGLTTGGGDPRQRLEAELDSLMEVAPDPAELERARPMLGRLLGVRYEDPRLTELEPARLRTEWCVAWRAWVEARAAWVRRELDHPLILIWEDFHWVDEPSREALEFLLREASVEHPFLILLLTRPDGPPPQVQEGRVELQRLALEPLGSVEQEAVVRGLLPGAELSGEVLDLLRARGQGNPYYLEELVLHLIETGRCRRGEQGWELDPVQDLIGLPVTLQSLLITRLDALGAERKGLLQRAAVLGHRFLEAVLRRMEGRLEGGQDPSRSLRELEAMAYLIRRIPETGDPAYSFQQLLARDAAYESLLHWNRRLLHRLAAESLEKVHVGALEPLAGQMADHWLAAGEPSRAADYLIRSAGQARGAYDNRRALEDFQRAAELLDPADPRVARARLDRATILVLVGEADRAREELAGMIEQEPVRSDPALRMECELLIAQATELQGSLEEARQGFEWVRAEGQPEHRTAAVNALGVLAHRQGRLAEAEELYREAAGWYEKCSLRSGLAACRHNLGQLLAMRGEMRPALAEIQAALTIRREIGDRAGEARSLSGVAGVQQRLGRAEEALRSMERAAELQRQVGDRPARALSLANLGVLRYQLGAVEEALALWGESRALREEIGDRAGQAQLTAQLGAARYARGEHAEALREFRRSLELARELGLLRDEGLARYNIALVLGENGAYADAEEQARAARENLLRAEDPQWASQALLEQGRLRLAAGDPDGALELYQQAAEEKQAAGDRAELAYAFHCRGDALLVSGAVRKAGDAYRRAEELRQEAGQDHYAMMARAMRARVLLELDQVAEADRLSDEAVTWLAEHDPDRTLREYNPEQVLFTRALVLERLGSPEARELRTEAARLVRAFTARIEDPQARRRVEQHPLHRPILEGSDGV